jgi:Cytochrome C and Quinol oxidase polypeptide I
VFHAPPVRLSADIRRNERRKGESYQLSSPTWLTIMLLLFATPLFVGFANEITPLQIGAPDVAFPRLNLLSYYLFPSAG